MNTSTKKVQVAASELAQKFQLDELKMELKRVQSTKCRLKQQVGRADYKELMTKTLFYEETLKVARQLLEARPKPVTQFTQEDVDRLDYDSTVRAIKSIQSKKTLTKWTTDEPGTSEEFKRACEVEQMLLAHKETVAPVDTKLVRKSDLQTVIDTVKTSGQLTTDQVLKLLEDLQNDNLEQKPRTKI